MLTMHFNLVQVYSHGNQKASGLIPIHYQALQNWFEFEKKNNPGIYIPHFVRKSDLKKTEGRV